MDKEVPIVVVPGPLFPLLRLVCDMLCDFGYNPISEEVIDLLCRDVELLAAMQRLAFRVLATRGQAHVLPVENGGDACQK
jgi:alanine dehydrogenase